MTPDNPINAVYRALDQRHAIGDLAPALKAEVFKDVSKRIPGLDWSGFVDALDTISALRMAAHDLADQARDTGCPPAAVARELGERFPGLDQDVLDRAVSEGFFESR